MDVIPSFWPIPPDMICVVIGVGAAAGRGLSGTANLGDHGADDPRRSQEPPALSAQRSTLSLTHSHTHSFCMRCCLSHKYVMMWIVIHIHANVWTHTHTHLVPLFFLGHPCAHFHTLHPSLTLWTVSSVVESDKDPMKNTWTVFFFFMFFTLSTHPPLSLCHRTPPARSYPRSKRWSRWQGKSPMACRT